MIIAQLPKRGVRAANAVQQNPDDWLADFPTEPSTGPVIWTVPSWLAVSAQK